MKKIIVALLFGLLLGGFVVFFYQKSVEPIITERLVLERISEQYFTVTKSLFLDEDINLTFDQGSNWSNFLWGKTVRAEGLVRVDIGVDMSKIKEEDIGIDRLHKRITINVPEAEILDASIFGNLKFDTEEGVLQKILIDSQNEDYNNAVDKLVDAAKEEALADDANYNDAKAKSLKLLYLIMDNFGYEVVYE